MPIHRPFAASACVAVLSSAASAQFYAPGFDASLYTITPDVAQANATATGFASAGVNPGGAAFDGRYLYVENADNPAEIARIDPTGAEATLFLARQYATATGAANDNLAADSAGVLWEFDNGTNNLYSLFISNAGLVSRTLEGAIVDGGGAAPFDVGDLAWGPDGLLYISSAQGNFTWDPTSGTTTLLGSPELFTGLAWFDGQLYGSVGNAFVRGLLPLDSAMNSGLSYIFEFETPGFTDLASFNGNIPDTCVENQPSVNIDGGVQIQTLIAGRHIDAGNVVVEVVGDDLVVTYETSGDWGLYEIHLWAGLDIADMPQTRRGNPRIGRFPYKANCLYGATSHEIVIPLESLGITCPVDPDRNYYIAAHAVVRRGNGCSYQTETAWADGDRFSRNRDCRRNRRRGMWGTYFSTSFKCVCDDVPPPTSCETAYATSFDPEAGALCFLDIDTDGDGVADFDRWGWTISIPDTTIDGFYEFPIYARAEDCDTAGGVLVGTLFVVYDVNSDGTGPGVVFVEYQMLPGYTMDEIHLYAGEGLLPIDSSTGEPTIALEQFPIIVDNFTGAPDENFASVYAYEFDWDGNGINIVAHALVCGPFD
jgi:hypothetical protein